VTLHPTFGDWGRAVFLWVWCVDVDFGQGFGAGRSERYQLDRDRPERSGLGACLCAVVVCDIGARAGIVALRGRAMRCDATVWGSAASFLCFCVVLAFEPRWLVDLMRREGLGAVGCVELLEKCGRIIQLRPHAKGEASAPSSAASASSSASRVFPESRL